jgi:hypothetical protein
MCCAVCSGSISGLIFMSELLRPAMLSKNIRGLLQYLQANVLTLPESGHYRFIAKAFQFITRQPLGHSTLYEYHVG